VGYVFSFATGTTTTIFTVMVYNRASSSDYDAWETLYGNKGWGSGTLIPLLKKVIPTRLVLIS